MVRCASPMVSRQKSRMFSAEMRVALRVCESHNGFIEVLSGADRSLIQGLGASNSRNSQVTARISGRSRAPWHAGHGLRAHERLEPVFRVSSLWWCRAGAGVAAPGPSKGLPNRGTVSASGFFLPPSSWGFSGVLPAERNSTTVVRPCRRKARRENASGRSANGLSSGASIMPSPARAARSDNRRACACRRRDATGENGSFGESFRAGRAPSTPGRAPAARPVRGRSDRRRDGC